MCVDTGIFEQFPDANDARKNYPNLLQLPKEAWFWKVVTKDEVVGLIDTFGGLHYSKTEEVQHLNWPNEPKTLT